MITATSSSRRTNRPNSAFEKALACLVHPLSLGALGLLLLNDQVLRRLWPSWITGKLSDAAWLFVVPFALAALVSWVLPRQGNHTRWTFALAYALTGLGFILVKTDGPANLLAGRAFMALTGLRPALSLDPSDLLALPALALSLGWCLCFQKTGQSLVLGWRLALLPLAALVLMADAAAPDYGLTCFTHDGSAIHARTGYTSMVSTDGGRTWAYDNTPIDCSSQPGSGGGEWRQVPGPQQGTLYRFRSGDAIQVSADEGKTWQTAYQAGPVSEAERTYLVKSHPGTPMYDPGPLDAIADPASGNMLFAMGQQGVLVHTPDGQWIGQAAGEYQPVKDFPTTDAFIMLIGSTALMAAGLALLIFASLALRWTGHWLRYVVLAIAWIGWAALDVLFPPAISEGYALTITGLGILAVAVFLLPLVIEQIIRLVRHAPRAILPLFGFGLAGGLLYLVPYLLWLYNVLPGFGVVTAVGLVLGVIVLAAGIFWTRLQNRKAAFAPTV